MTGGKGEEKGDGKIKKEYTFFFTSARQKQRKKKKKEQD
jgi:hypothetical protein